VLRRLTLACVAASVVAVTVATPASAHIHPDPDEAQAGSEQTVGFTIEHGCDGAPTVAIELLVPDGVTDVSPLPLDGWTADLDETDAGDEVVVFDDGSLPDGTEGTFEVTMTLPPTPDTTIYFPIVQRCDGGELRWIEIPVDGEEPDYPAPAMSLVGPVATTVPSSTTPAATPSAPETTPDSAPATTPDSAPATTEPVTTPVSEPATSIADDGDDDDAGAGTTVFIISVIAVLIVAALAFTVARRNRGNAGDTPAGDAG
jgi:uncharacterized protein YcnI